jgi:flagellar assembly protein FliH
MTSRARRVPAADAGDAKPLFSAAPHAALPHRVPRQEAEARLEAEQLLRNARAEAERVIADARARAIDAGAVARRDAEERSDAALTARWLSLRQAERRELEGEGSRILALAVALAERLLGASLELDPGRIAELARNVIAEAGGARRAVIDAHPLDADALRRELAAAALDMQSIEVREDLGLARGDLRLHTDLGTIDARLASRFDRLADALRDAFE